MRRSRRPRSLSQTGQYYAGADERYEHTIRGGLDVGIEEVGAVGRTPAAGTIQQSVTDGRYGYAGRSSYAGTNKCYEHAIRDSWQAAVATPLAVARTPTAGAIGQAVSDGRYEQAIWSSQAARLVPSGIVSMPFGVAGVLQLGWLALPSTPGWLGFPNTSGWTEPLGRSMRREMPCLSGRPELQDTLLGAARLAPSHNTHLAGITSLPFAAA